MNPERELVGVPSIRDDGCVAFRVRIATEEVAVTVSPLGLGVSSEIPLDLAGEAMQEVGQFVKSNAHILARYIREAGKLRRNAGRPPLIDHAITGKSQVQVPPERREDALVFRVDTSGRELRVFIFDNGSILDTCEDWDGVTDTMRMEAMAAVISYLLEHPDEAATWGTDVELYRDIWAK